MGTVDFLHDKSNDGASFFKGHSELIASLIRAFIKSNGSRPEELHHYTNSTALLKIIESGDLWASNALYLNDADEIEIGIRTYRDVIEGIKNSKGKNHSQRVKELLADSPLHIEMLRQSAIFVCCLSASPNQLSQWRAYGGSGIGYSIGLRSNALHKMCYGQTQPTLCRVLYQQEEQVGLVLEMVGTFAAYIDFLPDNIWQNEKETLKRYFISWIHIALLCLKNNSFEEESEWRLIYRDWDYGKPRFSFRASVSGLIVPYCAVRMIGGLLPLTRIIVGPTGYPEIAMRSVNQLLRQHEYSEDISVEYCQIPFRAL